MSVLRVRAGHLHTHTHCLQSISVWICFFARISDFCSGLFSFSLNALFLQFRDSILFSRAIFSTKCQKFRYTSTVSRYIARFKFHIQMASFYRQKKTLQEVVLLYGKRCLTMVNTNCLQNEYILCVYWIRWLWHWLRCMSARVLCVCVCVVCLILTSPVKTDVLKWYLNICACVRRLNYNR